MLPMELEAGGRRARGEPIKIVESALKVQRLG